MALKNIIGKVLKAPLIILVIASFIASIYAAANKIQGITYAVPIILGVILIAYIIGAFMDRRTNDEEEITTPTSE
jgi:flagellar biosynthesis protein FliQ